MTELQSRPESHTKVAFVLLSTVASGTERRIGRLFRHLSSAHPGRYHLIVSREVWTHLGLGGFGLEELPNIHILGRRSLFDRKKGAEESWLVNLGRAITLLRYRRQIQSIVRWNHIGVLQIFLEVVPFLGLLPIKGVKLIVSLVSHLPKYYDGKSLESRLLLRALRQADKVDTLYDYITDHVLQLGIASNKVNSPRSTCVDSDRFRPEPKERLVTFAARSFQWKNPLLMLEVVQRVSGHVPDARFVIMGEGPQVRLLQEAANALGLGAKVSIKHYSRPYEIVNRSLVHVCLEEYDNAPNQSTLEGMAAGCALVASDVGLTSQVVTPEVGVLVSFDEWAVADKVSDLLLRPAIAMQLGRAGRERILRDFNTRDYLNYLLQLHDFSTPGPIVKGQGPRPIPSPPC